MSNRFSYRDRHTKALMRRLEYIAVKPTLWTMADEFMRRIREDRRLSIPERIRFRHWLLWKYGPECAYCHKYFPIEGLTIDHIQPKSKGGAVRDIQNMALACLACNKSKGNSWLDLTPQVNGY